MFAPPISQQRARAQRAPAPAASVCRRRWRKRFSVPPDPTIRRQPSEHRRERQRAIKHSAILRERSEQSEAVCRRRWRNNAFPFRQVRRRWRQPGEHRRERQRAIKHSAIRSERSEQSDPRIARRRAEKEGGDMLFRPRVTTK